MRLAVPALDLAEQRNHLSRAGLARVESSASVAATSRSCATTSTPASPAAIRSSAWANPLRGGPSPSPSTPIISTPSMASYSGFAAGAGSPGAIAPPDAVAPPDAIAPTGTTALPPLGRYSIASRTMNHDSTQIICV